MAKRVTQAITRWHWQTPGILLLFQLPDPLGKWLIDPSLTYSIYPEGYMGPTVASPRGEWRGPDPPPTSVQTPLGISANPLKSFFSHIGGYPMYVYCNFYCSPAMKHGSDPPLFWGWRRHWGPRWPITYGHDSQWRTGHDYNDGIVYMFGIQIIHAVIICIVTPYYLWNGRHRYLIFLILEFKLNLAILLMK